MSEFGLIVIANKYRAISSYYSNLLHCNDSLTAHLQFRIFLTLKIIQNEHHFKYIAITN